MPLFTRPGDRAIDGLFAGVGQLMALMGWATVAVGMSTVATLSPLHLLPPAIGFVAGMLATRSWLLTLLLEVVMLAASAAVAPSIQVWVWLGAAILGLGRLIGFIQRQRLSGGA